FFFFFSSRRRHTRFSRDWSSDVCSSDLQFLVNEMLNFAALLRIPQFSKTKLRHTQFLYMFFNICEVLFQGYLWRWSMIIGQHPEFFSVVVHQAVFHGIVPYPLVPVRHQAERQQRLSFIIL